jgi:hypothetical protein
METNQNRFITYLNSLHNIQASGANALAESQALNPYFADLYEPFSIVGDLVELLSGDSGCVVVLTGHAGDGKSTIALDVLKQLRGLPANDPLTEPLKEKELVQGPNGDITIVKDMSELSAERRKQWWDLAFSGQGCWLIVSNTGPLLRSLADYASEQGIEGSIESKILEKLDQPIGDDFLTANRLSGFQKDLVLLNLTRLDNVSIGAKILTNMVVHPGWSNCQDCSIEESCPVRLNRSSLYEAGAVPEERVRWIYQRLYAYEQRLTLRQIIAHLAVSVTGGLDCDGAAQTLHNISPDAAGLHNSGLEKTLFSENFFGYQGGRLAHQTHSLKAVALLQLLTFGSPVDVGFERKLLEEPGMGWAEIPTSLSSTESHWRRLGQEQAAVRWRYALRRMAYIFGKPISENANEADTFFDHYLQSPSLRDFDGWQSAKKLTLSNAQRRSLLNACLRVLLKTFSGFNAGQFQENHSEVHITLRRPDHAVVQPTQVVIQTLPYREFDLVFDESRNLPALTFKTANVKLALNMPLLDFIRRRDAGELGNMLSPIHQGQLDGFRAELLETTKDRRESDSEVELIRAGIDGVMHTHRYISDSDEGILEQG